MNRHEAREAAFFLIFEKTFHKNPMAELIAFAGESRAVALDEYSKRLVLLVEEHMQEIDSSISNYLTNWKLERLPRVSLSILRLAFCELQFFPDIPLKVTINEAVELAKQYGAESDAAYINGVLASFVKAVPPQKNPESDKMQA